MDEWEIDRIVAGVRIPDGLLLMDQYKKIFKGLLDDVNRLDPTSPMSTISFVMKATNHCYPTTEGGGSEVDSSRALDCVTTLSYFVGGLLGRMTDVERVEFLRHEYREYEDGIGRDDDLTPWWDISDMIDELTGVFDEPDAPLTDHDGEDTGEGVS